jgi:hypothetical protein
MNVVAKNVGHRGIRGTLEQRFWQYVAPEPNSGCWLWDGGWCKGYGVISTGTGKAKQLLATHVSLALHGRPKPGASLQACHHCDMPACVNPDHLYWGTVAQNRADMFRRQRANLPIGSGHVNSKLTEDDVRLIRASSKGHKALAQEFLVCRQLISRIKSGQGWNHV